MKLVSIIALVATLLSFNFALAKTSKKTGYLIKTEFEYNGKKRVTAKKDFILDENHRGWNTMTEFKNNVVLLGRAVEIEKDSIRMEYLIVDGNEKPNGVVSAPSITAKIGESAKIEVREEGSAPLLSVTMTATKVEYTN